MSDTNYLKDKTMYQKADKLTAALFLVSNIISENEPLRTKIRSLGLELITLSVALNNSSQYDRYHELKLLEKTVLQIISYLDVAFISGLISEMNALILKKELEIFLSFIVNTLNSPNEIRSGISKEFFGEENLYGSVKDNILPKGYIGQNGTFDHSSSLLEAVKGEDKLKRKDQRTRNILALISKKGFVSIKDISSYIKGCSEKTVQRELNLLIQEGVVKKIGERRWSKYSLAGV